MQEKAHKTETHKGVEVALRPSRDDDVAFLLSSVMKSGVTPYLKKNHCVCGIMPRKVTVKAAHAYLEAILSESRVVICCDPEEDSSIWGYVWVTGDDVTWVYVKDGHRGLGIASLLFGVVGRGEDDVRSAIKKSKSKYLARVSASRCATHSERHHDK